MAEHAAILEKLAQCSDRVVFALNQNWHEDERFLEKLKNYYLYSQWKRTYPGSAGRGNVKLCSYRICPEVVALFRQYRSFLEIGYDLAFYRQEELVLFVVFHEYCYFVEDKYKPFFHRFLETSQCDCFGDICPEIPDFSYDDCGNDTEDDDNKA